MAACFHSHPALPLVPAAGPSPRPKVGVALSSGGAKGLAHIGVIQVLEESGIPVDAVAGTSMGAYVGAMWALGLKGDELAGLAGTLVDRLDLWSLVDPMIPPRRGFIGGRKVLERLRKSLGDRTFAELEKPFYCVATELDGYRRAVLHEGEVATAVLASLAIPGIVVPIRREGIEYIDGGVCEPLPVQVLRDCTDVDLIVAVNVLPKPGQTRRLRPEKPRCHPFLHPLRWLNQQLNLFARGNLLDILRGAAMGSQMRLVDRSASHADVLIEAVNPMPRWYDFNHHREYIALGRAAAEAKLPEIRGLLGLSASPDKSTHPQPTPAS